MLPAFVFYSNLLLYSSFTYYTYYFFHLSHFLFGQKVSPLRQKGQAVGQSLTLEKLGLSTWPYCTTKLSCQANQKHAQSFWLFLSFQDLVTLQGRLWNSVKLRKGLPDNQTTQELMPQKALKSKSGWSRQINFFTSPPCFNYFKAQFLFASGTEKTHGLSGWTC